MQCGGLAACTGRVHCWLPCCMALGRTARQRAPARTARTLPGRWLSAEGLHTRKSSAGSEKRQPSSNCRLRRCVQGMRARGAHTRAQRGAPQARTRHAGAAAALAHSGWLVLGPWASHLLSLQQLDGHGRGGVLGRGARAAPACALLLSLPSTSSRQRASVGAAGCQAGRRRPMAAGQAPPARELHAAACACLLAYIALLYFSDWN